MERIVITGMGTVNPLGLTVAETWKNVVNGVSGVGPITLFDSTPLLGHISAELKGFDPTKYMDAKEVRRRDRFEQMAAVPAKEAIESSGLKITESNAGRIGVIISSAIGGLTTLQDAVLTANSNNPRRVN